MNYTNFYSIFKCAMQYGHEKMRNAAVSNTEHSICVFLSGHDNRSQDDIASALKIEKSTAARAISSLEEKGFVTRTPNPENRRKNLINITESGKSSIAGTADIYQQWFDAVTSCLSEEELTSFNSYLRRVLERAEEINSKRGLDCGCDSSRDAVSRTTLAVSMSAAANRPERFRTESRKRRSKS